MNTCGVCEKKIILDDAYLVQFDRKSKSYRLTHSILQFLGNESEPPDSPFWVCANCFERRPDDIAVL